MILLVILASFALIACSSDDATVDGDSDSETAHFRGYVVDFATKVPLSGVTVFVLDNETGDKLDVEAGSTDATGYVEFDIPLPEGAGDDFKVGFLCAGVENESVDTYQFNLDAFAGDERLWLVDATTYDVAPLAAGIELTPGTTVVAGGVYWVNEEGAEEIVNCATVETDTGSGDVRYFADNGLPANTNVRDSVNPLNGFFIIGNIEPGTVNLKGMTGTNVFGTTRVIAVPDSICISNIYAETDSNPKTCD
jgi:hypothetical protein